MNALLTLEFWFTYHSSKTKHSDDGEVFQKERKTRKERRKMYLSAIKNLIRNEQNHQCSEHELGKTLGDGEGWGAWLAAVHGVTKSWTQLDE